jgi:hypothetical protein
MDYQIPKRQVVLRHGEKGVVDLMMLDSDGEEWYIASLTKGGELALHDSLPHDLGLTLDDNGRIVTREI